MTVRQLLTPLERIDDAALLIEDGIIAAVGRREDLTFPATARVIEFGDAILTPGLIDLHIHGAAGYDVMDATDDGLAAIERLMARHGVTSYCPTTVTAPIDPTLRALEALARAMQIGREQGDRARPLGIHLEGPFLSHARRGVHSSLFLQRASPHIFEQMWDAAGGKFSVLTIAPELEGALELIRDAAGTFASASDTPTPAWSKPPPACAPVRVTLRIRSMPCGGWIIAIPDCWARS